MKNFTKIVLYIVAGFAVAGLICIGIGALGNGFAKLRNFSYSFGRGGHIGFIEGDDEDSNQYDNVTSKEETTEFDGSELTNMDLSLGAGEYRIVPSKDGKIRIINKSKLDIMSNYNGGYLEVHTKNNNKAYVDFEKGEVVIIELPENTTFNSVNYEFGAGEFVQEIPISCGSFDLNIGAGRVEVAGLEAEEIDLELGAGEIIMKNTFCQNADINVGMGSLKFDGDIMGDLDAECSMGDIIMQLESLETDHNLRYDTSMGTINYGGSHLNNGSYEVEHDGVESSYDINCSMGNININFNKLA